MEVQRKESDLKDRDPKVIYGYFEIIGGYKFWKPNPMLQVPDEDQYNHNCDIDPNFRILEPIQRIGRSCIVAAK